MHGDIGSRGGVAVAWGIGVDIKPGIVRLGLLVLDAIGCASCGMRSDIGGVVFVSNELILRDYGLAGRCRRAAATVGLPAC